MPKNYLLFFVFLVAIMGLFALSSIGANDLDVADADRVENSELQKLVQRIEVLEQRLAALEEREPFIRQADSRAENEIEQPERLFQNPLNADDETGRGLEDGRQKINGRTWSVRLLGHRK